jgi:hypothetical protein
MKKYLCAVALVISSSVVGTVAADGVRTTGDQAFLSELAQQPTTPLLETLSGTAPKATPATDPYYMCTHTFCRYTSDCTHTLSCDVGVVCGEHAPYSYGYCTYL